jgi:hypothetical protein
VFRCQLDDRGVGRQFSTRAGRSNLHSTQTCSAPELAPYLWGTIDVSLRAVPGVSNRTFTPSFASMASCLINHREDSPTLYRINLFCKGKCRFLGCCIVWLLGKGHKRHLKPQILLVFMTLTMKNIVFWDVSPRGSVRTDVSVERIASIIRVTRIG